MDFIQVIATIPCSSPRMTAISNVPQTSLPGIEILFCLGLRKKPADAPNINRMNTWRLTGLSENDGEAGLLRNNAAQFFSQNAKLFAHVRAHFHLQDLDLKHERFLYDPVHDLEIHRLRLWSEVPTCHDTLFSEAKRNWTCKMNCLKGMYNLKTLVLDIYRLNCPLECCRYEAFEAVADCMSPVIANWSIAKIDPEMFGGFEHVASMFWTHSIKWE